MTDIASIPAQRDESQQAFLRYLPKRIAAFEQRVQRYRKEGWEHSGMSVLKGDLLRLADASSHYGLIETCRHLLILARMVGEHVANKSTPDPQQAWRMFAQLSTVTGSLPSPGEPQGQSEPGETPVETDFQRPVADLRNGDPTLAPVLEASAPATATIDTAEPPAPIKPAEPAEPAEPAAPAAQIESMEPIDPIASLEPFAPEESAEPVEQVETIETAAPSASAEPAEAVETPAPAVPGETIEPVEAASLPVAVAVVEPAEMAAPVALFESPEAAAPAGHFEPAVPAGPIEPIELLDPNEPFEPDITIEDGVRRVYHLNDGNAFAIELGQRLESEGYAIEPVESVEELSELLMCLVPQMLLVDASHMSELDAIATVRRDTQQRSQTQRRIQMVAMATQDNLESRRLAHRAGVDLLLIPPIDIAEIVDRLQDLDTSADKQKVRVLIVEDNRADALYAQTVLTRAGMQAQVVHDPMQVLESIKSLHPDLVLMDLHMPFVNGVEVTLLIREHPVFARLPIVFLSGESDPDSRLEAINAGGDDFLFKPIRPRHLIAAVRERMRRMHPVNKPGHAPGMPEDTNGDSSGTTSGLSPDAVLYRP